MVEAELIEWLRERVPSSPGVSLGIGDDAAVVGLDSTQVVISTDMLMDGVDFITGQADPRRIGRKALAVNLSDIAAMACRPRTAFVSLALNRQHQVTFAKEVYEGLLALAGEFDVALAGGDTNSWDGPLAINVVVTGEPTSRGVLRRDGAEPGDAIVVTGHFGGSILRHHFDFVPRVREALRLHDAYTLHAGMDVSDGLSLDLHRLAAASGCGAVVDLDRIPISADATELSETSAAGVTSVEHALSDGEDFELLLAVPDSESKRLVDEQPLDVPVTCIGEFVAEPGLWKRTGDGLVPLPPQGYEH